MCRKLMHSISIICLLCSVLTSTIEAAETDLVGWWKFDEDSGTAFFWIGEAGTYLEESLPDEIIVAALLQVAKEYIDSFRDLQQWETVKSELLDIRSTFERSAEPYWSDVIDRDSIAVCYNERHA